MTATYERPPRRAGLRLPLLLTPNPLTGGLSYFSVAMDSAVRLTLQSASNIRLKTCRSFQYETLSTSLWRLSLLPVWPLCFPAMICLKSSVHAVRR